MGKELSYQKYDPAWGEEPVPPVPDEYRGETVKAYVVIKPGTVGKVGEDEIIQLLTMNGGHRHGNDYC
jgi:hypothetical protein